SHEARGTRHQAQRGAPDFAAKRKADAAARRAERAVDAHRKRIEALEAKIAEREEAIKELEASMAAPGFYDDRDAARPIIDRHQALMWEVGDLMHQWEELSTQRQP
ncbi:MAG: ABC transporter C-terminal domain-containing protein, partial [Vicinamibacterales bacterium]